MSSSSSLEVPSDMPQGGPKEAFEFPVFRTREELNKYMEDVGYNVDYLHALGDSVGKREELIASLREQNPSLNGNAEALVEHLQLNHQELDRKESWYSKLLKMPGKAMRYSWETVKAHPYITTAVVLGLTAAALYYTGAGATGVKWVRTKILGSLIGEGAAGAAEVAGEAAGAVGEAREAVVEIGGGALEAGGEVLDGALGAGGEPGTIADMIEVITESSPEVPGSAEKIGEAFERLGNR